MSSEAVSENIKIEKGSTAASEKNFENNSENKIVKTFIKTLEKSEFFQQMDNLKVSLAGVAGELSEVGARVNGRNEEVETLAAHIMAIEAILAVIIKDVSVDPEAVKAEVARRSEAFSGHPDGSPTVQAVALDIVGG
ncbi:MAG: hypothetical protein OEW37_09665 [Rhodospirillaceae bacterium]|nr:hypothetical protein [Rhodospirillaceae bacterium]